MTLSHVTKRGDLDNLFRGHTNNSHPCAPSAAVTACRNRSHAGRNTRVTLIRRTLLPLIALLLSASWPGRVARAETAAELIERARQYDSGYTIGPEASRQKAIELYGQALAAGPDNQQRLETLFRMAQLHGCIFDRQKGERPDFRRAISFYQQVVESCPPEDPRAITAMGLISDHYTSLGEFDVALTWAKRAVEYDTTRAEENIREVHRKVDSLAATEYTPAERREIMERAVHNAAFQEDLTRMKAARVAAVDRVACVAEQVDPLRAHGELRAIADKYAGTPVGDRAAQRLQEVMDKQLDLWAPTLGQPQDSPATWRSASDTAISPNIPRGLEATPHPSIEITGGPEPPEPNATAKPQGAVGPTESPRAPPLVLLSACLAVAAGLAVAGLAALRIRRRTLRRNREHET